MDTGLRIKSKIVLAVILLILLALQDALVPFWDIRGIMLNLPVIFVVFVTLFKGGNYALAWAAVTGILMDLAMGKYLGLNLLSMLFVSYMTDRITSRFYKANYILPLVTVGLASLFYYACFLFFSQFAGVGLPFWEKMLTYAIPASLYNALIAPVFYVIVYLISERLLKNNSFD